MQAIDDVFAIWPSLSEMADDLGQRFDTVYRWKRAGRIPQEHWERVIERAATREKLVTASMLLSLSEPFKRRGRPRNTGRAA